MELECSSLLSALESAKSCLRVLHRGAEREVPAALIAASKLLTNIDVSHTQAVGDALEQIENLLQLADDEFVASCSQFERQINALQARLLIIDVDREVENVANQDKRLLRYIMDYLLRERNIGVAQRIAVEAGLELFCDDELHLNLSKVRCALEQRRDCTDALLFCEEHRASLAHIGSSLEVELRIQQLVVLILDKNYPAAIQFARAKLPPFLASFPHLVQQAMMLLALQGDTLIDPYRHFFSNNRWSFLADRFTADAFRVFKLADVCALQSAVLLGLTIAKTCVCGHSGFTAPGCPACIPLFAEVVNLLPQGPRLHTALLCPVHRCLMDDKNPPLALPSGRLDAACSYAFYFILNFPHAYQTCLSGSCQLSQCFIYDRC
jgi:macrophage erythroblast attacher